MRFLLRRNSIAPPSGSLAMTALGIQTPKTVHRKASSWTLKQTLFCLPRALRMEVLSLTSIFSRSSSSHTSTSEQKLKEALPELKPKPLETYDTPALRRIADGKFSIKVTLVLVGLQLYAWLQRQAGWDEVDPPVQVYKNGKFVKPEDWSPELKKKYGYIGRMVV
ncbi:hypothetical protein QFC21_002981 [Naganishia friedmannii]|uniref:Uncharacterized protein n=1 Tax=Naganishia friedmannii TaxID=89922 RepID=A0ACC2VT41_9TREE|nr:hypothetical protein QFC21_002981 [Naganishia friedmannii]